MDAKQINVSFGRCCVDQKFFDRFYAIFLASNPDFGAMFANTDFDKQKALLRQGISMCLMFAAGGNPSAQTAVGRLRKSHSKNFLNIDPGYYRFRVYSLIKTVSEFDPNFNPEIEAVWREAIRKPVEYMQAGYASEGDESQRAS